MPIPQGYHAQKGYALLTLTTITITIFLIIFIPLQLILVNNTVSTQIGTDSRIAFYGAETAIHDAIAKIMDTKFNWPENVDEQIVENLSYGTDGEIKVTRTVTKINNTTITIHAVSSYKNSQRTMTAQMGENEITPPVDVIIVLDTSTSMDDESQTVLGEITPDRAPCDGELQQPCEPLETAREAAKTLANTLFDGNSNARVSVIRFSGYAETVISLSSDHDAVIAAIDNITVQDVSGTNIGDGFYEATKELINAPYDPNAPHRIPFIVLMSDGSANTKGIKNNEHYCTDPYPPTTHTPCTHNDLDFESATYRARMAKSQGYTIYTVGLNLDELEPEDHYNIAKETLRLSSTKPDEEPPPNFFDVQDPSQLQVIYDTIGAKINESATVQIREAQ